MKLGKLFTELSFSELKDLALADNGTGNIFEEDQGALITHTNDALTTLHTKYILKQNKTALLMIAGTYRYVLSNEDLIQILAIYNHENRDMYLNHIEMRGPIISSPNIIDFTDENWSAITNVVYQANHPELEIEPTDLVPDVLEQDIILPRFLKQPLRLMIAHEVYSKMNGENRLIKSQELFQKFTGQCDLLEARGLVQTNISFVETDKFKKYGWT